MTRDAPRNSDISGHTILGAEIDGTFVFHLGDALSTVRDVVDDTGAVIKSFEFDEYGNLLDSSGTGAASPKTWIGGLSVNDDRADSGMFNMGHRNYSAGVLGRFISRDPIGHSGGLNLYAYPTNPVNFVDPSGLKPYIRGDRPDLLVDYLEKMTGLNLQLSSDGLLSQCPLQPDKSFLEVPDQGLRDIVTTILNDSVDLLVEVDHFSGRTPIGRFIGSQVQRIDMGDVMTIAETHPQLASTFVGHELTELYEGMSTSVPVTTETNWYDVFTEVHKRALEYERKQGCFRKGESMNKISDTHQTGHYKYTGVSPGTFYFRNKPGSFHWAIGR